MDDFGVILCKDHTNGSVYLIADGGYNELLAKKKHYEKISDNDDISIIKVDKQEQGKLRSSALYVMNTYKDLFT